MWSILDETTSCNSSKVCMLHFINIRLLLLIFLLMFGSRLVYPLNPEKLLTQYSYSIWSAQNGLPHDNVRSFTQTKDGYIWISTSSDLIRFDGVQFTLFNKSNTDWMEIDSGGPIIASRDGSLWVGTRRRGRIFKLRDNRVRAYELNRNVDRGFVQTLYEDRSGRLWVGTERGGVARLNGDELSFFTTAEGLSDNNVEIITGDKDGNIWCGTTRGISRISDGHVASYESDGSVNSFVSIHPDKDGNLWAGDDSGNLYVMRKDKEEFTQCGKVPGAIRIGAIHRDRDDNLWIGTRGRGLVCLRAHKVLEKGLLLSDIHYVTNKTVGDDPKINAILEDREGNIWVGTEKVGLIKISDSKVLNYSAEEGMSDEEVRAVHQDEQGTIWIGSGRQLYRLDEGRISSPLRDEKENLFNIRSIATDKSGNLWFGTFGPGLHRLKDGLFTVVGAQHISNIITIQVEADGTLWAGTEKGLYIYRGGSFTHLTTEAGLGHNEVRTIYADRAGRVWVGTRIGLSVYIREQGRFHTFTQRDGLSNDSIRSLMEDDEGSLWIGTHTGGLICLRDGKFKAYRQKDGLLFDSIFQIIQDSKRNLWLGTPRGICRVSLQEFKDFDLGRKRRLRTLVLDSSDGMRSRECNINSRFTSLYPAERRLIFPTTKGLVIVNTQELNFNRLPPPVHIERVLVNSIPHDTTARIYSPPGRNDIEIAYTGLSFTAPEKVRFKYILEGHDSIWIDAGSRRSALYTNLDPGHYTFRVMASNNDGVWNEAGSAIDIYLEPHFYQTYWFLLLVLIAVGGLIFWLHQLRVGYVKTAMLAVIEERQRLAREVHDTLGQGFVGVQSILKSMQEVSGEDSERRDQYLKQAEGMVERSIKDVRRTLLTLRTDTRKNGSGLTPSLKESVELILKGKGLQLIYSCDGECPRLKPSTEHHILRIVQEAVQNTLKHAKASHLFLHLTCSTEKLLIRIADDGQGFDVEAKMVGHEGHYGLIGMQERASQIGGKLTINSWVGEGTEILLEVDRK
jgi:ligand-binding sensor domain-containing protein/two-component sensor histidine kinase